LGERRTKSKIEDQRFLAILMGYRHPKNLPVLPRDKKEEAFFLHCGQTDKQAESTD